MILAAMATMPERIRTLEQVVAALRPQVDELRVYLNNFERVPDFLTSREMVLSAAAAGDVGDAGKFYWFDKEQCDYYFTVDDDLLYPTNYVARLIEEFEARKRTVVVGVHGFVFSTPIESYVRSRKERYKSTAALDQAHTVHVLGTGTTVLHPATIRLSMADFPRRNMADLQLAIAAQRQQVPMIVIPRPAGWIHELEDPSHPPSGFSIWQEVKAHDGQAEAELARTALPEWRLFAPTPSDRGRKLIYKNPPNIRWAA